MTSALLPSGAAECGACCSACRPCRAACGACRAACAGRGVPCAVRVEMRAPCAVWGDACAVCRAGEDACAVPCAWRCAELAVRRARGDACRLPCAVRVEMRGACVRCRSAERGAGGEVEGGVVDGKEEDVGCCAVGRWRAEPGGREGPEARGLGARGGELAERSEGGERTRSEEPRD